MRLFIPIVVAAVLGLSAIPGLGAPPERQIATVEIPENGYLSAAIYDADGQLIRTLFSRSPQSKGSVALKWNGRDDLGRAMIPGQRRHVVHQPRAGRQRRLHHHRFASIDRHGRAARRERANDRLDPSDLVAFPHRLRSGPGAFATHIDDCRTV